MVKLTKTSPGLLKVSWKVLLSPGNLNLDLSSS